MSTVSLVFFFFLFVVIPLYLVVIELSPLHLQVPTSTVYYTDIFGPLIPEILLIQSLSWRNIVLETLLISTNLQKLNSQMPGPTFIVRAPHIHFSPTHHFVFLFCFWSTFIFLSSQDMYFGVSLFFLVITMSLEQLYYAILTKILYF